MLPHGIGHIVWHSSASEMPATEAAKRPTMSTLSEALDKLQKRVVAAAVETSRQNRTEDTDRGSGHEIPFDLHEQRLELPGITLDT
eukprot:SAG31_NODE_23856_length_494_cov_0.817722_1_plen_86_part_00